MVPTLAPTAAPLILGAALLPARARRPALPGPLLRIRMLLLLLLLVLMLLLPTHLPPAVVLPSWLVPAALLLPMGLPPPVRAGAPPPAMLCLATLVLSPLLLTYLSPKMGWLAAVTVMTGLGPSPGCPQLLSGLEPLTERSACRDRALHR